MSRALVLALPCLLAALAGAVGGPLDLAGPWRVRLDPQDRGVAANWPASPLAGGDPITLPNTTDRAGFGSPLDTNTMRHTEPFPGTTRFPGVKEPERADEHGYLVRRHLFVGPAWYEREIEVPPAWQGRPATLRLERALWQTRVWVDGRPLSTCDSLVSEHRHELGRLEPGRHRLTIRVDNRMIHNLSTVTHAYGPETQSRWNGLIGGLTLEAAEPLSIRSLAAFPAADRRSVRVVVQVVNADQDAAPGSLNLRLTAEDGDRSVAEAAAGIECPSDTSRHEVTLSLAGPAQAWDEFHPVRYRLHARLAATNDTCAQATATFGFRHFERVGKELRLNGRPVFLRGTLDCAVYPQTGHPPMTMLEWERVLGVIKEYGFNHVRFHTWCPPDAAFEAADRLGVYLQAEAPAWVDDWGLNTVTRPAGIGRDPQVTAFLRAELRRMSEAYGNHPSFALCAIGNEFGMQGTDWEQVNQLVEEVKRLDPRRLYAGCGARRNLAADDFWFTHHSGASTRGVGPAHTDWDFAKAAETSPVPVIAHETGQRPVFPDYAAVLPKFTGPLLPLNLDRHRRSLVASGLDGQVQDFVRASARFQLVQYKAEHEAMLRTRGYAGYQLLMLNDFPGQSEALVGILDPFWETKGVVAPAKVRSWNAPTVVLARFAKFVWTTAETFEARIEAAHFGAAALPAGLVRWSMRTRAGNQVGQGEFETGTIPAGRVSDLGVATLALNRIREPSALSFAVTAAGVTNVWNLWVYPADSDQPEPEPAGVHVARALDDAALAGLRRGGKVLLLAHSVKNPHAARTGFESAYWSAGWWGNAFSSLGVLCDPAHPALAAFPNDGWSDWQWRDLCAGATTFEVRDAPAGFRAIVQPVPDFHFNTPLAHVFEAKVGDGSLLVCGYDLDGDLEHRPAARQFRRSLFRYAGSVAFRPTVAVPLSWVESRCGVAGLRRFGARVLRVDSEDQAHGNVAGNALDGDPASYWHTRWQPDDPMPHELVIDLGRELRLRGVTWVPRQDQPNGRIARAEVFAGTQATAWGLPLAEIRGEDRPDSGRALFPQPVVARFLRLLVHAEVKGQPFASLAELDVLTEGAGPGAVEN